MQILLIYPIMIPAVFLCSVIWAIWMFDENVKVKYREPAPWETFFERVGLGLLISVVWPFSLLFISVRNVKKMFMSKTNA